MEISIEISMMECQSFFLIGTAMQKLGLADVAANVII